ncbi:response regulator [Acidobacteriota bacterium]
MIRILLADDHTLVRKGIIQILQEIPELAQIDEANDGKEALKKIGDKDYDLILLDISLPGRSGLDILKQIKCMKPDLPVLILSMHPEEQYAVRSIRAGASGYMTKGSAPDELLKAIRKVADGGRYITTTLAEKLAFEIERNGSDNKHELLSDREYQVMCMIASGKTVKEIGGILSLSVKTISTHRTRILRKMDMKNSAQLTYYTIKQGLLD